MKIDKAKVRYLEENDNSQNKIANKNSRVSTYTEDFKGEYYNLKLDKLIPFKNQARVYFDQESLESLAQTIKEHGIRQPLTVIPSDEKVGYYEIVSGERRFRAAKLLGLLTVPCIIIHDKKRAEEISIIENIQRKDLHPIELMKAYSNLLNNNICSSYSEIAKKVGVSKSSVVEVMNLRNLAEEIRILLVENEIKARDFLRELCHAEVGKRRKLIEEYLAVKNKKKIIKPKRSIKTKSKILDMYINDNQVEVAINKIEQLTEKQKDECSKLLQDILDELKL
jgi:ParB family chromosome partitioning protein